MNRPLTLGSRGAVAALVSLVLRECSHGRISARTDGGTGTVNIFLSDAPLDLTSVKSVHVTLTNVVLYPDEDGDNSLVNHSSGDGDERTPVVILSHPATFDSLTAGATALLGTDEVPAGGYGRIRLEVSDAGLIDRDGANAPLNIESGKLDVPIRFKVIRDQTTGVVLDFDAATSVQVNGTGSGRLILQPVVRPKSVHEAPGIAAVAPALLHRARWLTRSAPFD